MSFISTAKLHVPFKITGSCHFPFTHSAFSQDSVKSQTKLLLKLLFTFSFLVFLINHSYSQTYQDPDKALRTMLGQLDWNPVGTYSNPYNPTPEFLYDFSSHVTDYKFFVPISNDVSTIDNFFLMYEEMWNAAADTTLWERSDTLAKRALQISEDTVQIITFNYDFLKIKEAALTTGNYFAFNDALDRLEDHANPAGDPFTLEEVYAATSSKTSHQFTDVHYRVDPSFLIYDERNSLKDGNPEFTLRIDFGDGNGFINFDPSVTTTHTANFPESGTYTTTVELSLAGGSVVNRSKFKTHIISGNQSVPPDHCVDLNGLEACFYDGCADGPQDPDDKKFVIYLEGIDILDFLPGVNRGVEEIYDDMIRDENLAELRNYGYNFVIVDWDNSRKSMKENAMYVAQLIDYIKCTYPNDHEIVLIGESMGGVIGRYALTYMETEDYTSGNPPWGGEPCHPELMHKTRLFISLDAPHQGANIPLSLQEFYKHITNGLVGGAISKVMAAPVRMVLEDIFNVGLGSDAVEELLLYHADTKNGFCGTGNTYCYTAHPKHNSFFDELADMGDYPRFCKMMALSNGSLNGGKQTRSYNTADRIPSDKIFEFNGEVYGRVLHFIKIPVFGAELDLRTNPQGSGLIYDASMGTWGIDIDVYFIGIDIDVGLISVANEEVHGQNLNSYCTNAGGVYRFGGLEPDANGFTNNNEGWPGTDFPMFKFSSTNNGNGHYSFNTEVGIPWVAQVGSSLEIYSDGTHFGFIPIKSGLDWDQVEQLPLSPDIFNTSWPARVNNSPFDVIAGIHPDNVSNFETFAYENNRQHLNMENQVIPEERLRTCPNADELRVYVLNREIGDEILYLNNREMAWSATFEAEKDVYINPGNNNPHYDYASGNATLPTVDEGFYSKEQPFAMLANNPVDGHTVIATVQYEDLFEPHGDLGDVIPERMPLHICCFTSDDYEMVQVINSSSTTNGPAPTEDVNEGENSSENNSEQAGGGLWKVYPNPAQGNLVISNNFQKKSSASIRLLDVSGRVVYQEEIESLPRDIINIDVKQYSPGLYSLQLKKKDSSVENYQIIIK